jgi:hypothetical protein
MYVTLPVDVLGYSTCVLAALDLALYVRSRTVSRHEELRRAHPSNALQDLLRRLWPVENDQKDWNLKSGALHGLGLHGKWTVAIKT